MATAEKGGSLDGHLQPLTDKIDAQLLGPVKKSPGKTIFFVTCSQAIAGCVLNVTALRDAATAAGAKFEFCASPDGSISSTQKCMAAAIAAKPDAVVTNSIDPALAPAQWQQLHAMKIPIIDQYGQFTPDPKNPNANFQGSDGYKDTDVNAKDIGAAIAATSNGKANVVFFADDTYPTDYVARVNGVKNGLAKYCPTCTFNVVKYQLADLNTLPQQMQAYIQSHPNLTWMVGGIGIAATYATAAVRASGRVGKLFTAGFDGEDPNIANLKTGTIYKFDGANGLYQNGWASMDLALRLWAGQSFNGEEHNSIKLLTHQNPGPYNGPAGFEQTYESLWTS
jgi:ABC-type sugar transport system substrate-binding protein